MSMKLHSICLFVNDLFYSMMSSKVINTLASVCGSVRHAGRRPHPTPLTTEWSSYIVHPEARRSRLSILPWTSLFFFFFWMSGLGGKSPRTLTQPRASSKSWRDEWVSWSRKRAIGHTYPSILSRSG